MNGRLAAKASTANPHSAIARPIGGSHSHKPSHETARKIPTAVASVAIGGHSRSQKPVHRARWSARSSILPVFRGTDELTELSISDIHVPPERCFNDLFVLTSQHSAPRPLASGVTICSPHMYRVDLRSK